MACIELTKNGVLLRLTIAKGAIRIADENGNHFSRPTTATNIGANSIEWMITNSEVDKLSRHFLTATHRQETANELKAMDHFIWTTKWATREALKTTTNEIAEFAGFKIYKYTETFFSFEKKLGSGIMIRITFKMGDYTLAPHLFVLIPFNSSSITLKNNLGKISNNTEIGSGAYAEWSPQQDDIKEIIKALAQASENHKNDVILFLER